VAVEGAGHGHWRLADATSAANRVVPLGPLVVEERVLAACAAGLNRVGRADLPHGCRVQWYQLRLAFIANHDDGQRSQNWKSMSVPGS